MDDSTNLPDREQDARHYSLANIDTFWAAGYPVALPVPGVPHCELHLSPLDDKITLVTRFEPPEPDLVRWRNISFRPVTSDTGENAEISVVVEDNLHAAYGLLTSVVDQLQLHGQPLAAAVALSITQHRGMFAGKAALTQDREVGLYGELLVLEYLVDAIGPGPAITSWQGPRSEEHDFVLSAVHLEVKTTVSEQRRHVMHGFTQLVPLRGVPLSLLSIQLTRSNADGGRTLAQLVSDVRAAAGGHRPEVDDCLEAAGWRESDADLYQVFWTKRSDNRAYDVGESFPALTHARLSTSVPNIAAVSDLSYRIDLTHFSPCPLPGAFAGLVPPVEDQP